MTKILIVDDEKPLANALKLKLEKEGYEATAVFNGTEAIAILGREKFDLMLLDLVMPSQDGFSVLEKIKDISKTMPVIVSSNLSQEEDVAKAKALGAVDYFIKSDTPLSVVIEEIKKNLK